MTRTKPLGVSHLAVEHALDPELLECLEPDEGELQRGGGIDAQEVDRIEEPRQRVEHEDPLRFLIAFRSRTRQVA